MASLVNYSSSSSSDADIDIEEQIGRSSPCSSRLPNTVTSDCQSKTPVGEKRKFGLPVALPSTFLALFPDKRARRDNPADHQDRVRTTPHVEGNWATHVYIEVQPDDNCADFIERLVSQAQLQAQGPLVTNSLPPPTNRPDNPSPPSPPPSYHISLCRPAFLKVFQIEPFVTHLRRLLQPQMSTFAFDFSFNAIDYLVNDEQTRSFLILEVGLGHADLEHLVRTRVDPVMRAFRQPAYYDEPRFHISVASVNDPTAIDDGLIQTLKGNSGGSSKPGGFETELLSEAAQPQSGFVFRAESVKCRIGNRYFDIPLG
ncbi:poly(U)-specific 3'-to-5' RNA exonuclease [Dimargaris cristalligena]|uniref:U6 snRNA phosphodiesterase 1 n=1 Tax=Dimargaris cristalligena TaxID=215637 RepID=A0A4P9ZNH3_9FUNG|nr:poly(U)-specific 3'-to-5' RNA exonuclease [Dimargaris cristalligena]RKP34964.1 U6 snRNA phosphodiesterase Usb1 [Dimargaris cristalligena]|eukprot:RKP34964.1 U6 snRNA phosphodiesterase Usb1 [Dimargaris cristalligena]